MGFNEAKTIQAAARLLGRLGGKAESVKLLALLYLADREAIRVGGRPITGDAYCSMDQGPVLCHTLELMESGGGPWGRSILKSGHEAILDRHPGSEDLSKAEIRLLDHIGDEHTATEWRDLVKFTHGLPEWRYPAGGRIPIGLREIAEAVGYDRETAHELVDEARHEAWFAETVGAL